MTSTAFSPDESRIVTASGDKTARIWDATLLTMSVKDLLMEAGTRLAGVTKEMRLADYPASVRRSMCAAINARRALRRLR